MSADTRCFYCRAVQPWTGPCPSSANGGHWTAAERIGALEQENGELVATLRRAHGLILVGARALRAVEVRGRRARRKALRELPRRPDSLELETEAAKISDTFAVMYGDPSLSVGPTFDRLEGRA